MFESGGRITLAHLDMWHSRFNNVGPLCRRLLDRVLVPALPLSYERLWQSTLAMSMYVKE